MAKPLPRMQRWQQDYPNRFALGQATLLAILAIIVNVHDLAANDLLARAAFVVALILLGFDTLTTSSLTRGARSVSNPYRWVNAGHLAWYFGAYMLLASWDGDDKSAMIGALVSALIFGGLMAFAPFSDFKGSTPSLPPGRYDTDRPITQNPTQGTLYLLWPLISAGLLTGLMIFPPENGWSNRYLFFWIVFLPWVFQLYPRGGDVGWFKGMWAIKTLGLAS